MRRVLVSAMAAAAMVAFSGAAFAGEGTCWGAQQVVAGGEQSKPATAEVATATIDKPVSTPKSGS